MSTFDKSTWMLPIEASSGALYFLSPGLILSLTLCAGSNCLAIPKSPRMKFPFLSMKMLSTKSAPKSQRGLTCFDVHMRNVVLLQLLKRCKHLSQQSGQLLFRQCALASELPQVCLVLLELEVVDASVVAGVLEVPVEVDGVRDVEFLEVLEDEVLALVIPNLHFFGIIRFRDLVPLTLFFKVYTFDDVLFTISL